MNKEKPLGCEDARAWQCADDFASYFNRSMRLFFLLIVLIVHTGVLGCGTHSKEKKSSPFFTSGSREADQRASQRIVQAQQLNGIGERPGEKEKKDDSAVASLFGGGTSEGDKATKKLSLYERLGAGAGLTQIVEDFTQRVLNDPRVNWERKGVTRGGFSIHRNDLVTWNASSENVALLKKHLAQFFALAAGGPAHYEGREIKGSHAGMHISNPEFDAAAGDLKATLDKLQVPDQEQKELLAILESTRPEIVTER